MLLSRKSALLYIAAYTSVSVILMLTNPPATGNEYFKVKNSCYSTAGVPMRPKDAKQRLSWFQTTHVESRKDYIKRNQGNPKYIFQFTYFIGMVPYTCQEKYSQSGPIHVYAPIVRNDYARKTKCEKLYGMYSSLAEYVKNRLNNHRCSTSSDWQKKMLK